MTRAATLESLLDEHNITEVHIDDGQVMQDHHTQGAVCDVDELQRYLTITSNDGEVWCSNDDTLEGVSVAILDALLGEVQWYPDHVLDLDRGVLVSFQLNVTFD